MIGLGPAKPSSAQLASRIALAKRHRDVTDIAGVSPLRGAHPEFSTGGASRRATGGSASASRDPDGVALHADQCFEDFLFDSTEPLHRCIETATLFWNQR